MQSRMSGDGTDVAVGRRRGAVVATRRGWIWRGTLVAVTLCCFFGAGEARLFSRLQPSRPSPCASCGQPAHELMKETSSSKKGVVRQQRCKPTLKPTLLAWLAPVMAPFKKLNSQPAEHREKDITFFWPRWSTPATESPGRFGHATLNLRT
jgi:hypothetical protein